MKQEQAMEVLKTGANVFLTGEPGSGKTYTVNQYIDYLRAHNIEPAITASTGIAATHLNGLTVHSWSGIGIKDKLSQKDLEKIASLSYITKRVKQAKVLVIDEISMLEAKTFDMVDLVCRKIRQSKEPFGGLQIVVVGDFFQLPPISRAGGEGAQFAFKAQAWAKANFVVCYLTEQYRQDDSDFLTMLSAIRINSFNDGHLLYLKSRMVTLQASPKNITRIFSHNFDVDRLNSQELAKLPGKAEVFSMFSRGQRNFVDNLKRGCLSPETLELKRDALVMFTKNNSKEGFVNGTLGKVVGFDKESQCPLIKITNGQTIKVKPMEWSVEEGGKVKAIISQFPLRLAWAITVHKSQGMSLDAAVIDLEKTFEFGQGYVALSRVRRLSGLFLLGYNQKAFLTHPEMQTQDQAFRLLSQETQTTLDTTSKEELLQKQNNFLIACGGALGGSKKKQKSSVSKKEKVSTSEKTLILIKQGNTIQNIAQERGITQGTVIGHLEGLVIRNKIGKEELERLVGEGLLLQAPEIIQAFKEMETDKLQPVFDRFNGQYSYDEIRLARLLKLLVS